MDALNRLVWNGPSCKPLMNGGAAHPLWSSHPLPPTKPVTWIVHCNVAPDPRTPVAANTVVALPGCGGLGIWTVLEHVVGCPLPHGPKLSWYGQAKVTQVEQACRQYLVVAFPALGLTPAERAQRRQQAFRFATCMRSHGVPSFPDPGQDPTAETGNVNPQSPAFKSAATGCESLLPKRLGSGG